jgi:hypothetical protein
VRGADVQGVLPRRRALCEGVATPVNGSGGQRCGVVRQEWHGEKVEWSGGVWGVVVLS